MLTDDDVKRNVAANLQRLLADRGLTRTALASKTGDALMTISSACAGKYVPGAGLLARIAEVLDVSVDRIVAAPPEINSRQSA